MFDIDTLNQINKEDRAYKQWEQEERSRILSMSNEKRKQAAWRKLFPKSERLTLDEMKDVVVW